MATTAVPSPAAPQPRLGRTPSGHLFTVPHTSDMFQTLLSPRRWGPAELLAVTFILLQCASLLLRPYLSPLLYVLVFAFWRLCYNLGLAALLRAQSNRASITTWLQSASPSLRALLRWFATKSMGDDYAWENLPVSFNAWLSFRSLAMIILCNDGFSYFILCAVYFTPFAHATFLQLAVCLPLALALFALSFWSKAAAHHVLGDFAWYWGDFFFTIDGDLVFDGVFEIFPHPMYTVGYAAYYGATLVCRSYPLLMVSLLAHAAQLLFLMFVEEPHIQKIYAPKPKPHPSTDASPAPATTTQPVATPAPAPPATPSDHVRAFVSTVPQPPVVMGLAVLLTAVLALSATGTRSKVAAVALLLIWRAAHWLGCALALPRDASSRDNLWMRWCLSHGSSRAQAHSSWQHIFLFSHFMNHALFLVAAFTLSGPPKQSWCGLLSAKSFSHMLGGASLIGIALVSVASAWSTVGYFGFFYGDFFVSPPSKDLLYSGVFRYVNNPECILGHLAYYGLAIVRESWTLFWLAVVCQIMHLIFIRYVEMANIEREYQFVRKSTALESSVERLPVVGKMTCDLRCAISRSIRTSQTLCIDLVRTMSKIVIIRKERLLADVDKLSVKLQEHKLMARAQEIGDTIKSVLCSLDWDDVVTMLEKGGIVVERVADGDTE